MSQHTQQKAQRLLAEGRVRPVNGSLTGFTVEGDSARHHVGLTCSCQAGRAGRLCSHLQAAFEWANASREDRRIMEDLLAAADARRAAESPPLTDEERASGEAAFDRL